jgi:hypothetical protein
MKSLMTVLRIAVPKLQGGGNEMNSGVDDIRDLIQLCPSLYVKKKKKNFS